VFQYPTRILHIFQRALNLQLSGRVEAANSFPLATRTHCPGAVRQMCRRSSVACGTLAEAQQLLQEEFHSSSAASKRCCGATLSAGAPLRRRFLSSIQLRSVSSLTGFERLVGAAASKAAATAGDALCEVKQWRVANSFHTAMSCFHPVSN
jgi:hypothetical protein